MGSNKQSNREKYRERGKHYTNILQTFAFPYYTQLILDKLNKYFEYDVSNKVSIDLNFIGYSLAKNIDNKTIIPNKYFYKVFLFLDKWDNLKDTKVLLGNNFGKYKMHDFNRVTFRIYENYNLSIQSFTISERYIISELQNKIMTWLNKSVINEQKFSIEQRLNNANANIEEYLSFISFIKQSIIKELCDLWIEDQYTYLNIDK